MTDYKKLYLKMFNAAEDAIQILIAAQRECEEIVISDVETPPEQNIIQLPHDDNT